MSKLTFTQESERNDGGERLFSTACFAIGLIGLLIGLAMTWVNWTSHAKLAVLSGEELLVAMNDRLTGVIVGTGWTLGSLLLLNFAAKVWPSE